MKLLFLASLLVAAAVCFGQSFTLRSNELGGQASAKQVLNSAGCNGQNISPQLRWENPPEGTKSFAVTVYDEDAPTGSGWWHWLIFDIDKDTRELQSGAGNLQNNTAPKGAVQSKTDFGTPGYGGPCPPAGGGFHRYVVTVYALKTARLELDQQAGPALVGFYLGQNTIEKASLLFYSKQ